MPAISQHRCCENVQGYNDRLCSGSINLERRPALTADSQFGLAFYPSHKG